VLGIALASVVRGNHLLAAAGTWISNPLTYLPLYWFNYQVGDALIGNGQGPALNSISRSTLGEQGWGFSSRLLLGSAVVATVLAILMGVLAFLVFRRNQVSAKTTSHP